MDNQQPRPFKMGKVQRLSKPRIYTEGSRVHLTICHLEKVGTIIEVVFI